MIDRLNDRFGSEIIDPLVDRLNTANAHRLATMWEVAFLDAFGQISDFEYERALPSGRKPDLSNLQLSHYGADVSMYADITTVSDKGRHDENPIDWLRQQIQTRARKRGLQPAHFALSVASDYVQKENRRRQRSNPIFLESDAKPTLALGPKKALSGLLQRQVFPFIDHVATSSETAHDLKVSEGKADFTVSYRPGGRYAGGGHLSYTVAASLRRNPLANALRNKVDQLISAPSDALRLIIACDGDCALFRDWHAFSTHPSTFTAFEIATEFLNENRAIDFVLLVGVERSPFLSGHNDYAKLRVKLIAAHEPCRSARISDESIAAVTQILESVLQTLPNQIINEPYQAARLCLKAGHGQDATIPWQWITKGPEMTIKLSARRLQRFLAGEISYEDFAKLHGWDDPQRVPNPFYQALVKGLSISKTDLEHRADEDDDHIAFTFIEGDAANGPFQKRRPVKHRSNLVSFLKALWPRF